MAECYTEDCIIYNDFIDQNLSAIILNVVTGESKLSTVSLFRLFGRERSIFKYQLQSSDGFASGVGFSKYSDWHLNLNDKNDGLWIFEPERKPELLISIYELKENLITIRKYC